MRIYSNKLLRILLSFSIALLLVPHFVTSTQRAQEPGIADQAERAIFHQALLDLTNPFTVLCVAAHPDDEDGSTLTVLRRKYGAHTVSLFSTFGEGGQNAVGPELYEQLGVIRARETIAASDVQGSEPHFLGMRDFGFSKSAEETFRIWGEKEALRRMVLQIRKLRPDVIITNHNTTSGHGHHQATGRLVLQAFDAAADPTQFPEQLKDVSVWQTQRLFVRGGRGPETSAPAKTFTIDPNEMDPIRGTTYAQQALAGLQKHATQGPWPKSISATGGRIVRYGLVRQAPTAAPLPDDAKSPIEGLHLPESISSRFTAPTIDNKPLTDFIEKRVEVLVSLVNAKKHGAFTAAREVIEKDPQRFKLMATRLDIALATAAGVAVNVDTDEPVLIPGTRTKVKTSLMNSGDADVLVKRVALNGFNQDTKLDAADKMLPGTETTEQTEISTPKASNFTVPAENHLYDGLLFGPPLTVKADFTIEGADFSVVTEIHRDVAPAIEILKVEPGVYVTTPATAQKPLDFKIRLINHLPTEFHGLVRIVGPNLETGKAITLGAHNSDVFTVSLRKPPPMSKGLQNSTKVEASVDYQVPKEPINRRPVTLVYADAQVSPGLKIGYLPSFDRTLESSLKSLGVEAKELNVAEIAKGELSQFTTIILDNRAYEAHRDLIPVNDRLLKYVEEGGTLLVFYHKTNEWNPSENQKRPQLAPYPILLTDDRVTEEDAPIGILQPRHPLLNSPNRITQTDFANWIQERGLYYPSQWDSNYTALLTSHDKGEAPLNGGLLVAQYGKGNYIYTSMVWYRQLREGIPGGYRFFANLISYGKTKPYSGGGATP